MYPQQQIQQYITGCWLSQAVYAAANLRLADVIADQPKTAEEIAKEIDVHAPSLHRLLRALASIGIFVEDEQHRFASTPLSDTLRKDVPGSQWAMAMMMGSEQYQAWGGLTESIRDGQPSFDRMLGEPIFDYLSTRPEQAAIFDQAMVSIHGRETQDMLDAYDFGDIKVLADVGGGNGSVLIGTLQKYPEMKGILFDLPNVVERAESNLKEAGVRDRCEPIAGSFFETAPEGADAYLMRHIIHDWDDEKSLTILKHVRSVIPEHGKLLVIETVIPPGNDPCPAKLLDLTMLLIPGGKERTEEEYRELYEQAGFRLTRIVPTAGEVSVIEGVPI